jgi:hypothetical protein
MEILKGLYRSHRPTFGEDNFGGNIFKVYSYNYFFFKDKHAWRFSSINGKRASLKDEITVFDDSITLQNISPCLKKAMKGEIINWEDNKIDFFIDEYFWGITRYQGIMDDNSLVISGTRDNSKDPRFPASIPSETYEHIYLESDLVGLE